MPKITESFTQRNFQKNETYKDKTPILTNKDAPEEVVSTVVIPMGELIKDDNSAI